MWLNSLLRNRSRFLTVVLFLAAFGLSVAPAQEKAAAPAVKTELGVRIPMRNSSPHGWSQKRQLHVQA